MAAHCTKSLDEAWPMVAEIPEEEGIVSLTVAYEDFLTRPEATYLLAVNKTEVAEGPRIKTVWYGTYYNPFVWSKGDGTKRIYLTSNTKEYLNANPKCLPIFCHYDKRVTKSARKTYFQGKFLEDSKENQRDFRKLLPKKINDIIDGGETIATIQ
ncbi:hypothetical protein CAPTEDRAFT_214457 [Capitella teleta]|uniref:Uncharacterized protein n=1 Tax=Capitella teleta TaxID=283909 RepID=R7UZZ3_CAPTE|nr:hypothetical protein CAPTEDRAFT_214457 [Capitella teleta]|eukprot:ELU09006.1 hypothetical protein CAPTEDRAFT_214457 [Capitella teleta]